MKQYNIYTGIDKTSYQYTGLFKNYQDALDEARAWACELYDNFGRTTFNQTIVKYCRENNICNLDLTDKDLDNIKKLYDEIREDNIDYYVVLTSDDNIDSEDLILDYIIEDGSVS